MDNTLRRQADVEAATPTARDAFNPAVEWDGFATNSFDGLGIAAPLPPPVPARIRDIQGAEHLSPPTGSPSARARHRDGAAQQRLLHAGPDADGDAATSEGIFVFTRTRPDRRRRRRVSGRRHGQRVPPRRQRGTTNLTITELTAPAHRRCSRAATRCRRRSSSAGGGRNPAAAPSSRTTPSRQTSRTSGVFDPASDGIDFYETPRRHARPGQRRRRHRRRPATSARSRCSPDNGAGAGAAHRARRHRHPASTTSTPSASSSTTVLNGAAACRWSTSATSFAAPSSASSTTTSATSAAAHEGAAAVRRRQPDARGHRRSPRGADQLTVATFNVENLDPADGAAKFDALAALIVNNLHAPDIVALEEVQDNNGATNDGVVDAADAPTAR